MHKSFVVALALATPLTAAAQEKSPQVLTVEQVIKVSNGLAQLDCFQAMDGGIQQGCKKQFEISLATRLIMARNIDKGSTVFQSYQKERARRQKALMNDKGELDSAARARFDIEDREALEAPSGVTMEHVKKEDILKESTPAPSTVIALILPILE